MESNLENKEVYVTISIKQYQELLEIKGRYYELKGILNSKNKE